MTATVSGFSEQAESRGFSVDTLSLTSSQSARYTHHVYLVESEIPLFDDINSIEWQSLQRLVGHATRIVWVTDGGLLSGRNPLFAMAAGVVRGLKTERGNLRVSTLDLDMATKDSLRDSYDTIFTILDRLSQRSAENYTLEYRQKDHIIYRSSLQPDDYLNDTWQARAREQALTHVVPLHHFDKKSLQLKVDEAVTPNTCFFEIDQDFGGALQDGCVEIKLEAVDVSSKGSLHCSSTLRAH